MYTTIPRFNRLNLKVLASAKRAAGLASAKVVGNLLTAEIVDGVEVDVEEVTFARQLQERVALSQSLHKRTAVVVALQPSVATSARLADIANASQSSLRIQNIQITSLCKYGKEEKMKKTMN